MENLQNLAGKIEELKEKLTDGEYKDLLELAHAYYDRDQQEKAKKKFIKVMCITSTISSSIVKDSRLDPDCVRSGKECIWWDYDEDSDDYDGPLDKLSVIAKVKQQQQIILFEVTTRAAIDGFCIDMKKCKMTDHAYDTLLKDKYMVDEGHQISPLATFVYLSHFEL